MNKILFLDRDGIINYDEGYTYKIQDFHFIDGIFELCRIFKENGFLIVIVTNQAGIARGYYTENDFYILTKWMIEQFKDNGVVIDDVYFCPYHEEKGIGEYRIQSPDRKPNPGMLLKAKEKYNADMSQSVLIGDKESDISAGINAGVGTVFLVSKIRYPCDYTRYFKDLKSCLIYCKNELL